MGTPAELAAAKRPEKKRSRTIVWKMHDVQFEIGLAGFSVCHLTHFGSALRVKQKPIYSRNTLQVKLAEKWDLIEENK